MPDVDSQHIDSHFNAKTLPQKYKEHQSSVLLQRNIRGMQVCWLVLTSAGWCSQRTHAPSSSVQARALYAPLRNAKRKAATGMQKSWRMFHQVGVRGERIACGSHMRVDRKKSLNPIAHSIPTLVCSPEAQAPATSRCSQAWRNYHAKELARQSSTD